MAEAIRSAGFQAEIVETTESTETSVTPAPDRVEVPADAPEFFLAALAEARRKDVPVVIDFHAPWCLPCRRLDDETLHHEKVERLLEHVQLVKVDLDRHPSLAKIYGVASVPHVVFIARDGLIVDRLERFEKPGPFRNRLKRLLNSHGERAETPRGS